MGKASRLKSERQQVKVVREPVTETHEPLLPQNWPDGHVAVALRVRLVRYHGDRACQLDRVGRESGNQ